MPRSPKGRTDGRRVGRTETRSPKALTQNQQLLLGALTAYCLSRDTAVFVGTPTTTGSIRVNLYPPDDKCVGALSLLDNFFEAVPELLSDVFEEDVTIKDLEVALPWLAELAAKAPRDRKPTLRPSEEVEVPQRPAQ